MPTKIETNQAIENFRAVVILVADQQAKDPAPSFDNADKRATLIIDAKNDLERALGVNDPDYQFLAGKNSTYARLLTDLHFRLGDTLAAKKTQIAIDGFIALPGEVVNVIGRTAKRAAEAGIATGKFIKDNQTLVIIGFILMFGLVLFVLIKQNLKGVTA